jgi:hypothetical protein
MRLKAAGSLFLSDHPAGRQDDMNGSSFAEFAFDPECSAMKFCEAFRQGKPKPGSFMRQFRMVSDLTEGFLNPVDIIGRNSVSIVGDGNPNAPVLIHVGKNHYLTLVGSKFNRIR